ncbi:MAG: hypothetical protein AAF557_21230 [Pseudomonadota bacterium]
MGSDQAGWVVMGLAIAVVWCSIMVLLHVPGVRPSDEVLHCDSLGGYWSSDENVCHRSDSPAAGMAS